MHTLVSFIHFRTRDYLMTGLGLKMGCSILFFFLHIKTENQALTDRTHLQNELIHHDQLQYYAQHIVHTLVQQR